MLLEAGAAILGIAFLVKAAMWPLGFWLLSAYPAAAAPVAAVFAILSKVGIYVLLRLCPLLFGAAAGEIGRLRRHSAAGRRPGDDRLRHSWACSPRRPWAGIASFSLLVSSGTLLAAIGLADAQVTGGALLYLVSSTLTIGAFFLLIELVERGQNPGADLIAVTAEALGEEAEEEARGREVGTGFPGTLAVLGACFVGCALAADRPAAAFGLRRQAGPARAAPRAGRQGATAGISGRQLGLHGASPPVRPGGPARRCRASAFAPSGRRSMRSFPASCVVEIAPVVFLLLLTLGLARSKGDR